MSAPIAAVAFDLDGTLIDSASGVRLALNTALASIDLPGFELATVRSWIGDGPDALIRKALRASQLGDTDPAALALRLREAFDHATLHDPSAQGQPYAGIAALLQGLSGVYPLAVVTNKPTRLARAVLDTAGLLGHFMSVHGADTEAQRKPSPLLIQQAARQLELSTAALLMVGDGPHDLQAARAAGSHAAWVSWGYGRAATLLAADVWRLDAPHELLTRLRPPETAACHAPIH